MSLPPHLSPLRPPGAEAWPVLWALVALCAIGFALSYPAGISGAAYPLLLVGVTLLLTQLVLWLAGSANARQGRAFLASDRPLVRWVYTPEEWQQVRSFHYEGMRRDRPPLGCLPALFSLPGLLAGAMVGLDEGLAEALLGAVIGLAAGAAIGGLLILPVMLINRAAAERLLREQAPATVAIGAQELFYERVYFDGRSHHLAAVRLRRQSPPRLQIDRYAPRYSVLNYFPTVILVPPRMLPAVHEALPQLKTRGAREHAPADEEFEEK